MITIKEQPVGGAKVSLITDDGYFHVYVSNSEIGVIGEPSQHETIEEAEKEFDQLCMFMESV